MGKVRPKTLGDEEQELKEKQEAEARRLAKIEEAKAKGRAAKSSGANAMDGDASAGQVHDGEQGPTARKEETKGKNQASESPIILNDSEGSQSKNDENPSEKKDSSAVPQNDNGEEQEDKPAKKKKQKVGKSHERSENYKKAVAQVEKGKLYKLDDALSLIEKTHLAKFDETVELHINTTQSVNGSVTLPHGTGKSTRVAILAPSKDAAAADALLKEIEGGKINFDILIATPDAMPRLAKVARILGPKGLMPNPKNGTVSPNPETVAKQYEGGHMTFKTESKAPVLHVSVGKLSFGPDKLSENIKALFKAVKTENMKKVTLKSTMSPAVKVAVK